MDNCWISCQVMADMEKNYNDRIIINLSQFIDCYYKYVVHSTVHLKTWISFVFFMKYIDPSKVGLW